MNDEKNVLGGPLAPCSTTPRTGFYCDGCCNTGPEDFGLHVVCVQMTEAFLAFSKETGNDCPLRIVTGAFAQDSRPSAQASLKPDISCVTWTGHSSCY